MLAVPATRRRHLLFIEKGMIRTFYDKGGRISLICFTKMILQFGKRAAYLTLRYFFIIQLQNNTDQFISFFGFL